jgi:hypothetical protein
MSDYAYTYDLRQDESGFDRLTDEQRRIGEDINAVCRRTGEDRANLLRMYDADPGDKAAVAEMWGGEGAGLEFLR